MGSINELINQIDELRKRMFFIGITLVAISIVVSLNNTQQFFISYLLGYLFCSSIAFGSLVILLIHNMSGGGWGFAIRNTLLAAIHTIPFVALLFIPIIFGLKDLYIWTTPEKVADNHLMTMLLEHKEPYLNTTFFIIRNVIYFAIWSTMAHFMCRWSAKYDETGDMGMLKKLSLSSGLSLVILVLSMTLASYDWVMSLEPDWFSTMLGPLFIVGQVLLAFAFCVVVTSKLAKYDPLKAGISQQHFQDLGTFLLAFVMFWMYLAFSQFLITWSADLPEETTWYLNRSFGGWPYIAAVITLFHFFLPLILLLMRQIKRKAKTLAMVAIGLLFMRFIDIIWTVAPTFYESIYQIHWLNFVLPLGLFLVWLTVFLTLLKKYQTVRHEDLIKVGHYHG